MEKKYNVFSWISGTVVEEKEHIEGYTLQMLLDDIKALVKKHGSKVLKAQVVCTGYERASGVKLDELINCVFIL